MARHHETGSSGEQAAVSFLQKKGYEILERNWRYSRAEIDIIALLKSVIVFVEVKTRRSDIYGFPEESVKSRKRKKMAEAAEIYIEKIGHNGEIRFDIISVTLLPQLYIHHIEDAFFPGLDS